MWGEGECPDFYPLLQAARYLGVAPWELAKQSRVWLSWALASEAAEAGAQVERLKLANFRNGG